MFNKLNYSRINFLFVSVIIFDHIFFFQDYTITMYLNQYWKDERLAFSNNDEVLTLSGDFAEKIWVPDTFFANDKNRFDNHLLSILLIFPCAVYFFITSYFLFNHYFFLPSSCQVYFLYKIIIATLRLLCFI